MSERGELAALVSEQWASMSRDEQREASPAYLQALADLGVKPVRSRRVGRLAVPDATGIDPDIARRIDESGLAVVLRAAVAEVVSGAALRPTAARAGISHQTLSNVARRLFGEPATAVTARYATQRLLSLRERFQAATNTEHTPITARALAC